MFKIEIQYKAYPGDIADSVPDHCNKANITIKQVTLIFWFPTEFFIPTRIKVVYTILVKNSPAMQETLAQSLGWKNPLEKGMATCSSIPAWRIPWTEKPGRLQSMGSQRAGHN